MKRLLKRLKLALWRRLAAQTMLVLDSTAPIEVPEWTADDRGRLLGFLQSETGRKLIVVLRCKEQLLREDACDESQKRVDHARGKAVGYRQATASLIVLSAPPPPEDGEKSADDSDRGAEALREQHSP